MITPPVTPYHYHHHHDCLQARAKKTSVSSLSERKASLASFASPGLSSTSTTTTTTTQRSHFASPSTSSADRGLWETAVNSEGKTYYWNTKTRAVRWENPGI